MSSSPASSFSLKGDTIHDDMMVLQSLSLSNIVCDGKRVPCSPLQIQRMILTKNNDIIFQSQSNENKFEKIVPRRSIRALEVSFLNYLASDFAKLICIFVISITLETRVDYKCD